MAVVAVVATLGLLMTFVSLSNSAPLPWPSVDSHCSVPNSPISMAPQARELERELSGGVTRESGIEYSAVVVVTERPGVDWLDFVLFDEENTGGLNSASMIASVSWTVLSRVVAGLRLIE